MPVFQSEHLRLTAIDADQDAPEMVRWTLDSEYDRMLDTDAAQPVSGPAFKVFLADLDGPNNLAFAIRTQTENQLIGFMELNGIRWAVGDAWVAIGFGPAEYRGRGYGAEAMRLMLAYAFQELGLRRVSLSVFGYNTRAQRSYEKAGFVVEGRMRGRLLRDGQRWDMICMAAYNPAGS